jgi:hypothetical protein
MENLDEANFNQSNSPVSTILLIIGKGLRAERAQHAITAQ